MLAPACASSLERPVTVTINVRDSDQAMIQSATIEARCGEKKASVQTGPDGAAALRLAPGNYRLSGVAPWFGEMVQEITVDAAHAAVEVVLKPGWANDTVNVSADAGFVPFASNFGSKTGSLLVEVPQSISIISRERSRRGIQSR